MYFVCLFVLHVLVSSLQLFSRLIRLMEKRRVFVFVLLSSACFVVYFPSFETTSVGNWRFFEHFWSSETVCFVCWGAGGSPVTQIPLRHDEHLDCEVVESSVSCCLCSVLRRRSVLWLFYQHQTVSEEQEHDGRLNIEPPALDCGTIKERDDEYEQPEWTSSSSFRTWRRSSDVQEELRVEVLLLPNISPRWTHPGGEPGSDPGHSVENISQLVGEHLSLLLQELMTLERNILVSVLRFLLQVQVVLVNLGQTFSSEPLI